jgi:hypothetical protein
VPSHDPEHRGEPEPSVPFVEEKNPSGAVGGDDPIADAAKGHPKMLLFLEECPLGPPQGGDGGVPADPGAVGPGGEQDDPSGEEGGDPGRVLGADFRVVLGEGPQQRGVVRKMSSSWSRAVSLTREASPWASRIASRRYSPADDDVDDNRRGERQEDEQEDLAAQAAAERSVEPEGS